MFPKQQILSLSLCVCVLLGACAQPAKKTDVLDLYELPRVGQPAVARPMVIDNDSYYMQPTGYKGCTQINDAPSCGGG